MKLLLSMMEHEEKSAAGRARKQRNQVESTKRERERKKRASTHTHSFRYMATVFMCRIISLIAAIAIAAGKHRLAVCPNIL